METPDDFDDPVLVGRSQVARAGKAQAALEQAGRNLAPVAVAVSVERRDGQKVVVMGAGPAGLSAGYALAQAGWQVEVYEQLPQVGGLARTVEVSLRYVKPHGALYHMACRDDAYARPVVLATALFGLKLMGLPGSRLEALSAGRCPFASIAPR